MMSEIIISMSEIIIEIVVKISWESELTINYLFLHESVYSARANDHKHIVYNSLVCLESIKCRLPLPNFFISFFIFIYGYIYRNCSS